MKVSSRDLEKSAASLSDRQVEEKTDQDYLLAAVYSVGAALTGALEDLSQEVRMLREAMERDREET